MGTTSQIKQTKEKEKMQYILCAATHFKDDKKHTFSPKNIDSGLVICGWRHCNCLYLKKLLSLPRTVPTV